MLSLKIRAVWLCNLNKMGGNYFLSEYVPRVCTKHSTYILRDMAGLIGFFSNITVFKVCINPLNSVLYVSSEVRLRPLSALLSILSHCVRQHVSTRFAY